MCRKKVLVFMDWYLPGTNSGGPVMSVSGMVEKLMDQVDFLIVTRITDYESNEPYVGISTKKWVEQKGAQVVYLAEQDITEREFRRIYEEVEPDYVYLNSFFSSKFALLPLKLFDKEKVILAPRGMLSKGSLSVKSLKKKVFLTYAKLKGLYSNLTFHASSSQEEMDIRNIFPKAKVKVALNLRSSVTTEVRKTKEQGVLDLIFVGRIAPEKNLKYALEVLDGIEEGKINMTICGAKYSSEYWQECQKVIERLSGNIKVNYKGSLSKLNLVEELKKAHVVFLPSTGENFGHAIIEGMELGCIPLISNLTPWTDLSDKKCGYDFDLKNPELFRKTVVDMLSQSLEEFEHISKNAIKFASEVSNDEKSLLDNLDLFA